jgi:hypothetical protein
LKSLIDEALRLNERYLVEVVEAFDFCPYARGARQEGEVERRVVLPADEEAAVVECVEAIAAIEARAQSVIGLLILPRLAIDAEAFDRFVNRVRERDQKRRRPPFALAAFHPEGRYGTDTPEKLVMLLRRSPDPTIQLVRFSALEGVKGARPSNKKFLFHFHAGALAELERRAEVRTPSEKIAQNNFATVSREGEGRVRAIIDDIIADRERTYARLK